MSKDDKIRMPMSSGGLVNYYEDAQSKISFKPAHVVIFTIAIVFLFFMLHTYGASLFNLK